VQGLIDVENLYVVPSSRLLLDRCLPPYAAQIDGCLGSIRKTRPHMDAMR
jgi:hypothetical protein